MLGLRAELRIGAVGDAGAVQLAGLHQFGAAAVECLVELGEEVQRLRSEDLFLPANRRSDQSNTVQGDGIVHGWTPSKIKNGGWRCAWGVVETGLTPWGRLCSAGPTGHRGGNRRGVLSGTGRLRWIPPEPGWMRSG